MDKGFYVAGLQRSGTNYLQSLLIGNFIEFRHSNNRGYCPTWKHSVEPDPDFAKSLRELRVQPNCYLMLSKNPYTWIESLCFRRVVDYITTQDKFGETKKQSRSTLPSEEFLGDNELSLINLSKTWNHWALTWVKDGGNDITRNSLSYHVRYEDLLYDSHREQFLKTIQADVGLVRKEPDQPWHNPRVGSISQSNELQQEMLDYYKKMRPADDRFTQVHLDIVNKFISDEALAATMYPRVTDR